jgi:hypothetical protein
MVQSEHQTELHQKEGSRGVHARKNCENIHMGRL